VLLPEGDGVGFHMEKDARKIDQVQLGSWVYRKTAFGSLVSTRMLMALTVTDLWNASLFSVQTIRTNEIV
jgi:hypothetical protein